MKIKLKNYLLLYILQILITLFYAYKNKIKIFNLYFIISETIITVFLIILITLLYYDKTRIKTYIKKFLIYIFLFIPLLINVYLNFRVVKINNIDDFKKIDINTNGRYIITSDIDFKGYNNNNQMFVIKSFNGYLDGNDKSIYNLEIPLFQVIENNGVIEDLHLKDVKIKLKKRDPNIITAPASVTQINNGLIRNVHVNGEIEYTSTAGGLVALNNSIIEYSSFSGLIKSGSAGGLAAINWGIIRKSYTQGKIISDDFTGGIAGVTYRDSKIEDCYTIQEVYGNSFIGGIVGENVEGEIKSSLVLGSINGESYVGAIGIGSDDNVKALFLGEINTNDFYVESNIFYKNTLSSTYDIPKCF